MKVFIKFEEIEKTELLAVKGGQEVGSVLITGWSHPYESSESHATYTHEVGSVLITGWS